MVFDGSVIAIAAIYFGYVNKNWYYFGAAIALLSVISAIAGTYMPESPRYLLS